MNTEHLAAFGRALAQGDFATAFSHASEQVELFSPIFEAPFVGTEAAIQAMTVVKSVVSSTERQGVIQGDDRVIQFGTTTIDDVTGNSMEVIELDAEGLITRITVFWRPLRLALVGHAKLATLLKRDPVI
ncbi:hypothetical protein ACQEDT_21330 [Agrobacterium pusense]|uniref:hypothetical protein n=1 Tax=Agrobacterium pusense TaxID=648995 RepID=UPI003D0C4ED1